jgi:hypothetical protein
MISNDVTVILSQELKMTKATKPSKGKLADWAPKPFRLTPILGPVQPEEVEGQPKPEPVTIDTYIEIIGVDSKVFFEATKERLKRVRDRAIAKREPEVGEIDDEDGDLIVKTIVGWDEEFFGEFSPEAVRDIIFEPGFRWIRVQVEATLSSRANFYKK